MSDLSKQIADYKQAFYLLLSEIQPVDGGGNISVARFDLIGNVKVKIDQLMPEGEGVQFEVQDLVNTTDTVNVQINAFLDPSAKFIHQTAPLTYINGDLCITTPVNNSDGTGYVELPADFLRLQSFKMSLWEREVNEAITPNDPKYKLQGNISTRGGKAKPVCVIMRKKVSAIVKKVIQYYSLSIDDTPTVEQFIYVPNVVAENVQASLIEALCWACASKVLEAQGYSVASDNAKKQIVLEYEKLI